MVVPRSAPSGQSAQCEGGASFPRESAGAPSCLSPVALQISAETAASAGRAQAISGHSVLSAIAATADQALTRSRKRSLFMAVVFSTDAFLLPSDRNML
jgi:hypothetical protein